MGSLNQSPEKEDRKLSVAVELPFRMQDLIYCIEGEAIGTSPPPRVLVSPLPPSQAGDPSGLLTVCVVFLPIHISEDLDGLPIVWRQVSPFGNLPLYSRNHGILSPAENEDEVSLLSIHIGRGGHCKRVLHLAAPIMFLPIPKGCTV